MPGQSLKRIRRWGVGILAVLLFWYLTNSWPIVAVVNFQPIWRWELEQAMYDQIGSQAVDSLIIEKIIVEQLSNKRVEVADSDVDARLANIDEELVQALAFQGLTEEKLKSQIKMQLGLEKLVEPSTDSAVLQERIYGLVQSLQSQAKVWLLPRRW